MKSKKVLTSLLAVVMVLSMSACGGNANETSGNGAGSEETSSGLSAAEIYASNSGASRPSDVTPDSSRKSTANSDEKLDSLTVGLWVSPTDLSPSYGGQPYFNTLPIYETLLWQTDANEYVGYLAKDFREEDDTHFIVELYDYITDSDGNNITASDVVFSYNNYIDSGRASGFGDYFDSIEAVDTYTVRFTWTKKLTSLSAKSSILANCWIVSEKAYNDHNGMVTDPVGTGPYVVTNFVTDTSVDMEARADYWQTDELRLPRSQANVQKVRVDVIQDSAQRLIALENGSIATDPDISSTDITELLEGEYAGKFVITVDYSSDVFGVLPNMSEGKITADENFRQALWYALDSEGICAGLGNNMYVPCTTIATRASSSYQEKWNDLSNYLTEYDVEKAKEYLAKTDYNGETLKILVEQFPAQKSTIAQILENYWAAIGVNVEINLKEHAICMQEAQDPDNWDFWICSSTYNDYISHKLESWFDTSRGFVTGQNQAFLVDNELNNLLTRASSAETYSDEANDALLTHVLDHSYVYPICYGMSYNAWDPRFASVYQDAYSGNYDNYYASDFYFDN